MELFGLQHAEILTPTVKLLLSGKGEAVSKGYVLNTHPTNVLTSLEQHWYAVYTRPSHEKRVDLHLSTQKIEHFLPLYRVVRRWKNRCTKHIELPLFPGYVFVKFALSERVHVLNIPSVVSIVSLGRNPIPVGDSEIEALRAGLHLRRVEPHPYLGVGQRVRICKGALTGMEGVIVRKKNSFRIVLTLELIMKSIAVEVDGDEIEPAQGTSPGLSRSNLQIH